MLYGLHIQGLGSWVWLRWTSGTTSGGWLVEICMVYWAGKPANSKVKDPKLQLCMCGLCSFLESYTDSFLHAEMRAWVSHHLWHRSSEISGLCNSCWHYKATATTKYHTIYFPPPHWSFIIFSSLSSWFYYCSRLSIHTNDLLLCCITVCQDWNAMKNPRPYSLCTVLESWKCIVFVRQECLYVWELQEAVGVLALTPFCELNPTGDYVC